MQYRISTGEKFILMDVLQDDVGSHNHNYFELVYIVEGTALHTLNDVCSTLQPGDFFFVDYGSYHSYTQCNDLRLINCLFLPEAIDETMADCSNLDEFLHACMLRYYNLTVGYTWADRILHDSEGTIRMLLQGLVQEYKRKEFGAEEIYRCRLTEIMVLTLRMLLPSDPQPCTTFVQKLTSYIEKNYGGACSLQAYCQKNHYNLSYISRRFKEETGKTFREYMQKVRVEKSCELLLGSDLSIQEISRSVGYEDIRCFHRVFKKLIHMTPKEYRKIKS